MRAYLFAIGLLSASSAAAQTGTYRAGAPYAANPATSAQQCISTCAGDAACRGWNFVTLREDAAICEFNSRDATPVPSPNAVSGTAPGATPASHRLVRTPGSATVRIGQPVMPKPATKPAPQPKATARTTLAATAPTRRIIQRRPVPQQRPAQPAAHTRRVAPVPPQARQAASPDPRMMFRHSLEGSHVIAPAHTIRPPQPAPRPAIAPAARPTPRPAPQAAPTSSQPVAQAPAPVPTPAPAPQIPMSAAAAQDSLFGSLYDDVSIPAPANPKALADPDAPVATSVAVPVTPVNAHPLQPNLSGLAGAKN